MDRIELRVNGLPRLVVAEPEQMLSDVLRKQLLLTGCKSTCEDGQCGACSLLLNGKLVRSCIVKMKRVPARSEIVTIEGIGRADDLHPLQVAWMANGSAQCGVCTPGFIMTAKALLDQNPKPTREEVREAFQKNHNACRCTGYRPLVDAVMTAAEVMRGEKKKEDLLFQANGKGILGSTYQRPSALAKVNATTTSAQSSPFGG